MIRRGDTVMIIAGKERGKRGQVIRVLPKSLRIVVDGLNLVKRHLKPRPKYPQGGVVEFPSPLNSSNALIVCSQCGKPMRVASKLVDGSKIRVCRKCGAAVSTTQAEKPKKARS